MKFAKHIELEDGRIIDQSGKTVVKKAKKPKKELTPAQKAERRRKARERHWVKTGAAGAVPWMKRNGFL